LAGGAPLRAQRRGNVLSTEEIERAKSNVGTAYDLVQTLRPRWLQVHELTRLPGRADEPVRTTPVHAYVNDVDMGQVDYLKTIPGRRGDSGRGTRRRPLPPRDAASWDCAGTRSVVVRATLRTAWKSWKPWRVPPSSRRHCCAPGPGPRALACRGWHCRTPPGGGARPAPGSAIERTLPAPAVIVPRRSYAPGSER